MRYYIIGLLCQKLQIPDDRQHPFWIYANKQTTECFFRGLISNIDNRLEMVVHAKLYARVIYGTIIIDNTIRKKIH